jgi:hypothetical protein
MQIGMKKRCRPAPSGRFVSTILDKKEIKVVSKVKVTSMLAMCALAVCALAGLATAASAAEFHAFNSEGKEIKGGVAGTLENKGNQVFKIGAGLEVVCTELKGSGETTFPTISVQFTTVSWTSCTGKAEGVKEPIDILTKGVDLLFDLPAKIGLKGTVIIEFGKTESPLCTVTVAEQEGLEKATYSPKESKAAAISASTEVTNIKQTNTCGATGEVLYTGTGSSKATGDTFEIK